MKMYRGDWEVVWHDQLDSARQLDSYWTAKTAHLWSHSDIIEWRSSNIKSLVGHRHQLELST